MTRQKLFSIVLFLYSNKKKQYIHVQRTIDISNSPTIFVYITCFYALGCRNYYARLLKNLHLLRPIDFYLSNTILNGYKLVQKQDYIYCPLVQQPQSHKLRHFKKYNHLDTRYIISLEVYFDLQIQSSSPFHRH